MVHRPPIAKPTPSSDGSLALEDTQALVRDTPPAAPRKATPRRPHHQPPDTNTGASATERSDLVARGPLTSVSLVCLVASEPVACRSGA
jgi:hypothetical protein